MSSWQDIEITDFEELSFEQSFRRLSESVPVQVTSFFNEDASHSYLVEFVGMDGKRYTVEGPELAKITAAAWMRALFTGPVADA